ncbi:MAG TPA: hypothetical protein DCQ93_07040 [Bacteroidetes bacterium]|nr:hypothetical protein [Bacteroidota bacterium]
MARLFELENNRIEKQNQVKGIITSIAIHGLLLLLFYFLIGATPPIPPLDGGGVEINFGYMDDGMGDVQPIATEVSPVLPQAEKPSTPEKSDDKKIISQENSDVVVNTKQKDNNKKKTTTTTVTTNQTTEIKKEQQPKALFKGWTDQKSSGEGDGKTPGDKGQLNGTPNGTHYTGNPGFGNNPNGTNGIGYSLSGRKMTKEPTLKNNSQEYGIVVINIKVNKQGKVISADGPGQGSTNTSTYLYNLARTASLAAQFDVNSTAADEQHGTITYNFKLK